MAPEWIPRVLSMRQERHAGLRSMSIMQLWPQKNKYKSPLAKKNTEHHKSCYKRRRYATDFFFRCKVHQMYVRVLVLRITWWAFLKLFDDDQRRELCDSVMFTDSRKCNSRCRSLRGARRGHRRRVTLTHLKLTVLQKGKRPSLPSPVFLVLSSLGYHRHMAVQQSGLCGEGPWRYGIGFLVTHS